ncbi:MAG: hypothetical protein HN509_09720 [Halobacteriovoraceae bacterium]|jgi:hypothetical protein|nr:hypothetical protein [Halobacteriovoraceae bacterium]MBT5095891.1 hypothetical protein [Halobacteriovoraceae bacterium]
MTNGKHMQALLDPKNDALFFSGSILLTPLIVAIYYLCTAVFNWEPQQTVSVIYFSYLLCFDQPHIIHTFSRAFFDPIEWARKKYLLVLLFIATVVLMPLYFKLGYEDRVIDIIVFYGFWHVFKQNIFLLDLYQQKCRTFFWERLLEKSMFYFLFGSWFFQEILDPENIEQYVIHKDTTEAAGEILLNIGLVLFAIFVLKTIWQAYKREPVYWSKLTFICAILVNYIFLFLFVDDYLEASILLYLICDGIYHGVQKFGFMKLYYRVRFPTEPKKFQNWLLVGLIYAGLALPLFHFLPLLGEGGRLLSSTFIGVVIFHYLVEDLIWKVNKAPELRCLVE